jgi:hypothetical protein
MTAPTTVPQEVREAIARLRCMEAKQLGRACAVCRDDANGCCNALLDLPAPARLALAAVLCQGTGSVVVHAKSPAQPEGWTGRA